MQELVLKCECLLSGILPQIPPGSKYVHWIFSGVCQRLSFVMLCIPKAESFGSHLDVTIILVLRIKQQVDSLAQFIKLIKAQVKISN